MRQQRFSETVQVLLSLWLLAVVPLALAVCRLSVCNASIVAKRYAWKSWATFCYWPIATLAIKIYHRFWDTRTVTYALKNANFTLPLF